MCYVNGSVMYIDVFSNCKCAVDRCAADAVTQGNPLECVHKLVQQRSGIQVEVFLTVAS